LRTFAETFFQYFGAQLHAQADELIVDLPPELAPVFGKSRLYLVFPQGQAEARELSPVEDLLVYGSRVFDQMLSLLAGRGQVACLYFPGRVTFDPESQPSPPLPLHGCELLKSQVNAGRDQLYLFHFRASYVSDEKQEAFVTVLLDAEGQPAPTLQGWLNQNNPDIALQAEPFPIESKILPQISAKAGEIARQQIQAQVDELEKAIKPRLERVLLRLSTYYRRLMVEVNSGDPAQDEAIRADLQRDLNQKIAEELERHRLHVTLAPVSLAVASLPLVHYQLHLATPHTRQVIKVARELYTGQLVPLPCYHCHEPLDHLALCDRAHAVHRHCQEQCQRCDRTVCRRCGIQACGICGQLACVDCQAACTYCDRWLCTQHVETCPICESAFCSDHGFRCRWCNQACCYHCGLNGACQTCQEVMAAPAVDPSAVPVPAGLDPSRYHWQQAGNKRFNIYVGYRAAPGLILALLGRRQFILVTDNAEKIVYQYQRGWWQRLLKRG
jgi:hypothetical protein